MVDFQEPTPDHTPRFRSLDQFVTNETLAEYRALPPESRFAIRAIVRDAARNRFRLLADSFPELVFIEQFLLALDAVPTSVGPSVDPASSPARGGFV